MISKAKTYGKFNIPYNSKNIASSVETSPNTFSNKLARPFYSPNLQNKKVGSYMKQLNQMMANKQSNKKNGSKLVNTF